MDEKKHDYYNQIVENLLTKEDVLRFESELQQLEKELFQVESPFQDGLERILPYEKKERILKALQTQGIEATDLVKIQEFIRELRSYLSSIPVVSLTCAYQPTQAHIRKFLIAITDATGAIAVIDIVIDSSILGGALIEIGGKYEDYSLKKRVSEYFKQMNNTSGN